MASSPAIQVAEHREIDLNVVNQLERGTTLHITQDTQKALSNFPTNQNLTVIDKTLSSTANLAQLLPTGTVLAFEALSSSFTNNGQCSMSNKYLTALLIYFCLVACVILSFTDSLLGQDGKLYYGLATFKGFYVFNFTGSDDEAANTFHDLQKLRIRPVDLVHAFFTAVVFLSVAFSDTGVQSCFFPKAGHNTHELLINLPLGAAALSGFIFLIFPTTRKGIGYTNVNHQS
ncbi:hypothetical protein LUZ63_002495 [Rhynchospora breviuscula]|uniref:Uncharacterized protein n=1 Tax=Rhynchospora breviuscula TaxID=2022672 RepID=A0A9Q0HY32_9POAL|nr:hypothetical protein LUZ63_002495 [Rhynchospora breviuscula]